MIWSSLGLSVFVLGFFGVRESLSEVCAVRVRGLRPEGVGQQVGAGLSFKETIQGCQLKAVPTPIRRL